MRCCTKQRLSLFCHKVFKVGQIDRLTISALVVMRKVFLNLILVTPECKFDTIGSSMQSRRALLEQMQDNVVLQQLLRQNSYFVLTEVSCSFMGCYIFIDLFYFSGKLHDSISQPEYALKKNSFSGQKKIWLTLTIIFILTVLLR